MYPTKKWLALWEESRPLLQSPSPLGEYFAAGELNGRRLALLPMGNLSLPTGQLLAGDPFYYLDCPDALPYYQPRPLPTGEFPVQAAVLLPQEGDEGDWPRYAAVEVIFREKEAVRYEEALLGSEELDRLEEGQYFGFDVNSGLAAICDQETQEAYRLFCDRWYRRNPQGDLCRDYFEPLFAQSYRAAPLYQREQGDWISWTVPGTQLTMPIFQSGYGDGAYPVYFGYDEEGEICRLVVQFIDLSQPEEHPSDQLSLADFDHQPGLSEGEIRLPQWDELFGCCGPYTLLLNTDLDHPLDRFTAVQLGGYDYRVRYQQPIARAILEGLWKEYPRLRRRSPWEGAEKRRRLPPVKKAEELARLLRPVTVVLHDQCWDGLPYVGVEFRCTWDPKFGFGVMLWEDQIVAMGGAETAILSSIARKDLDAQRSAFQPHTEEL